MLTSIRFLQRGVTPQLKITETKTKIQVSYFLLRSPNMKFQMKSAVKTLERNRVGYTNMFLIICINTLVCFVQN